MGFCELLVESQYDNPRLMRPFKKATYYEKIHCREGSEEESQPFIFNANNGKDMLMGENNNKTKKNEQTGGKDENEANKTPKLRKFHRKTHQNGTTVKIHGAEKRKNKNETEETAQRPEQALTLKKLAEKVQEFNERFKS